MDIIKAAAAAPFLLLFFLFSDHPYHPPPPANQKDLLPLLVYLCVVRNRYPRLFKCIYLPIQTFIRSFSPEFRFETKPWGSFTGIDRDRQQVRTVPIRCSIRSLFWLQLKHKVRLSMSSTYLPPSSCCFFFFVCCPPVYIFSEQIYLGP